MNRNILPALPKLSSVGMNLKRSLFDIELLLNLRPKIRAKSVVIRATPVTRWNE
jgi:hypothetical protein